MSQSSTPIMNTMPHVIIPAMVFALGPQFSKLPVELVILIFKYVMGWDPVSLIIHRRDKLNTVCKAFFNISNFVFYSCQTFNPSVDLFRRPFQVPTGYFFPPVIFRNLVRRLKITIELKDYYVSSGTWKLISCVQHLFVYCPGANRLQGLTSSLGGFGSLQLLELVVLTDYNFPGCIGQTETVLRRAAFGLNAAQVYVLAVDSRGHSQQYHEKVVDAILDQ